MKSPLYFHLEEGEALRSQFAQAHFTEDRRQLVADLEPLYRGELAPSLFSWWCENLPGAFIGGEYQASLETLLAARWLLADPRAAARAREILLQQAEMNAWTEPDYGNMGHDLASSHHCRGMVAGLDACFDLLSEAEVERVAGSYVHKVRGPYLNANYSGNAYLRGHRNTNWLAHLSGSVMLSELALAKFGREDRATLALAKAHVLRYVDMIRPDGSLPENGDYFQYGMEYALLGLYAWDLHFRDNLLQRYSQMGLRRAIDWVMAFTDRDGTFWADFGDTHIGQHAGARVVGYLYGRAYETPQGQWLGDVGRTREPLVGFLRKPGLDGKYAVKESYRFSTEQVAVVNLPDRHLALQGGASRSKVDDIPHRHYDTGSLIYRLRGVNVLADSGHDRYTPTFWTNYDDPRHERSAPSLHNGVLADGRGHQIEDAATGRIERMEKDNVGHRIVWRLDNGFPGVGAWERRITLNEKWLVVEDRLRPNGAKVLSVLWHHWEKPRVAGNRWEIAGAKAVVVSDAELNVRAGEDHPKPYVSVDVTVNGKKELAVVSVFSDEKVDVRLDDRGAWINGTSISEIGSHRSR